MKQLLFILITGSFLWSACNTGSVAPKDGSVINGTWTYRSMLNGTDVNTDFDSLAFAAATMQLTISGIDSIKGTIYWFLDSAMTQKQGLVLRGKYFYNDSTLCYFMEGIGDSSLNSTGWQYNYQGFYTPQWPEGIDQATVFTGSVVRVKKHSCDSLGNNCHMPGVVASTYIVKQ
ncbi:MAG: hypothetical protein ABI685_05960 [Ferruginibacter sp.]